MATELDHGYCGWPHEEPGIQEDSEDSTLPQLLDHGSISFGRYASESLAWEKRSAFTHDRRQEELEKLKAPGLVAEKKAFFEQHYKRLRAMKSAKVGEKSLSHCESPANNGVIDSSTEGAEAEVSSHLSNLKIEEVAQASVVPSTENCRVDGEPSEPYDDKASDMNCVRAVRDPERSLESIEVDKNICRNDEENDAEANQDDLDSSKLRPCTVELPSLDVEATSACEQMEKPASSSSSSSLDGKEPLLKEPVLREESSRNGNAASCSAVRKTKAPSVSSRPSQRKDAFLPKKESCKRLPTYNWPGKVSSEKPSIKSSLCFATQKRPAASGGVGEAEPHQPGRPFSIKTRSVKDNATSASKGPLLPPGAMPRAESVGKFRTGSQVNGERPSRAKVRIPGPRSSEEALKPVDPPLTRASRSSHPRKERNQMQRVSDADGQRYGKKPRRELKPWR